MTEKGLSRIISPRLSDLEISSDNGTFGLIENLVDSQLLDADASVSTVQTQAEQRLLFYPQLSPYGLQPECSLKHTAEKVTREFTSATVARPSSYFDYNRETTRIRDEKFVKEKTTYFPIDPVVKQILSTAALCDWIPTKTVAERDTVRREKAAENLVTKNLSRKSTATSLVQMEAFSMRSAAINPAGRKVKPTAEKPRTTDGYQDEMNIEIWTALLQTCPSYYRKLQTKQVFVVTLTCRMASVGREEARTSSG